MSGYALKFGDAGKITLMSYTEVIFGYLIDIFVIGTKPEAWSIIGTLLIVACIIIEFYRMIFVKSKWGRESNKIFFDN